MKSIQSLFLSGVMLTVGCTAFDAAQPSNEMPSDVALAAYLALDLVETDRGEARGAVADALTALTRHEDGAALAVLNAAQLVDDATIAQRLATIAVADLVNDYRYGEAVEVAARFGIAGDVSPLNAIYARFPAFRAETGTRMIEVAFDGMTFQAKIGDRDVKILLDTGAPNVGVTRELVQSEGYRIDRSVSRQSVVPAYGLDFPVYAVLIDELQIGDAKLFNIRGNSGEVPPEQQAGMDRLIATTPDNDLIMGLDALSLAFEVIELDYTRKTMRLYPKDPTPKADANYILGSGAKPVVKSMRAGQAVRLYLDTGAYGNIWGEGAVTADTCLGVRTFKRSWGSFSEYQAEAEIFGERQVFWVSPRAFGADEAFGVSGVFGNPRNGTIRIDMADRNIDLVGYSIDAVQYDYAPVDAWSADERPCFE